MQVDESRLDSEARHDDGSGRPAWAVQCECMKKALLTFPKEQSK